jgi:hypothetical protein
VVVVPEEPMTSRITPSLDKSGLARTSSTRAVSFAETRLRGRWFLLCTFFLVGAWLANDTLGVEIDFLLLTLLNTLATVVFVARLRGAVVSHLWLWMMFAVFIDGYFLQLYWTAYNITADPSYIANVTPELVFLDAQSLATSYYYFTFAFLTFVGAALFVSMMKRRVPKHPAIAYGILPTRVLVVSVFTTFLFGLLAAIQASLGLGQLGANAGQLPFALDTLLALFVQRVGPAVLLLCAWMFDGFRPRWSNVVVLMLALLAALETYITTSRGIAISLFVPVVLMWIVLVLLVRPLISNLRVERLTNTRGNESLQILDLQSAANSAIETATRVTGAYGVWQAQKHQEPFGPSTVIDFLRPNYLTSHFTYDVVGLPRESAIADFRSPGVIGGAMVLGGSAGVLVIVTGTIAGFAFVWRRLQLFRAWPVVLALVAQAALEFTSESSTTLLVKFALAIALVEFLCRRVLSRPLSVARSAQTRAAQAAPISPDPAPLW